MSANGQIVNPQKVHADADAAQTIMTEDPIRILMAHTEDQNASLEALNRLQGRWEEARLQQQSSTEDLRPLIR